MKAYDLVNKQRSETGLALFPSYFEIKTDNASCDILNKMIIKEMYAIVLCRVSKDGTFNTTECKAPKVHGEPNDGDRKDGGQYTWLQLTKKAWDLPLIIKIDTVTYRTGTELVFSHHVLNMYTCVGIDYGTSASMIAPTPSTVAIADLELFLL